MKQNFLKNEFYLCTLLVLSLFVGACSNISTNDIQTQEKIENIKIELRFGDARQIMPTTFLDATFTFSGTHGTDSYEKAFTSVSELNNERFAFAEGEWNFTLAISKDGATIASSTLTTTISASTSSLTFEFKTSSLNYESGKGSVSVTLNFPSSDKITKVTAGLYDSTSATSVSQGELLEFTTFNTNGAKKAVSYLAENVTSGSYYLIFNLYQDTAIIAKWFEFVYVANGTLSEGACTVENINEIFKIEYEMNGISFKTGFTAPTSFNTSQIVTLPVIENLDQANASFTGWYESTDFSGNAITGWGVDEKKSDVKIYARNIATVTFNLNGYGTAMPEQKEVVCGTKVTEPIRPTDETMVFLGWYSDSALTAKFDFETGAKRNTTLYAKWVDKSEYTSWKYPTSAPTLTWTGSGTENFPYVISTAQQLADFAYMVNYGESYSGKFIKLAADIDLNEGLEISATTTFATEWHPIGNSTSFYFAGTFEGDGHTINGLYINSENYKYAGLFGYVLNGTVQNTVIGQGYISNKYSTADSRSGAIAGYVNKGKITSCGNKNTTISDIDKDKSSYVGGIVGCTIGESKKDASDTTITTYVEIRNCYNKANVTGHTSKGYIGGIVGYSDNYTNIYNSYNAGSLKGYYVGGIIGYSRGAGSSNYNNIYNCYNYGKLDSNYKGGIIGYIDDSSYYGRYSYIYYSYYYSETTNGACYNEASKKNVGSFASAGGSVSDGYVSGGTVFQNLSKWVTDNNTDNKYSQWKEINGWPAFEWE